MGLTGCVIRLRGSATTARMTRLPPRDISRAMVSAPNLLNAGVTLRVECPDASALLRECLEPLHAGELELLTEQPLLLHARLPLQAGHPGAATPVQLDVQVTRRWTTQADAPAGVAVRIPLQDAAGYARLRQAITERGGSARVPVMRVLLVEDNAHIVKMYSRALRQVFPEEQASMDVECVENGHEALQRLAHAPAVDLVVTDLYMPVIDGFVLAEKMKQEERTRDIPVVLISAAGQDAEEKARQLGIKTFLHKPVQLNMIVDSVRQLLVST